jgi:metallo-beta-lactamase class B
VRARAFSRACAVAIAAAAIIAQADTTFQCTLCATWNQDQKPFRIYGDTYYVGVRGLAAILVASDAGHILIDGDLAESAPKIAASIRALGYRLEDVKVILNTHVHYDHAGGLSALQRLTGARVLASPWSAGALRTGRPASDDPQYGELPAFEPVERVEEIHDGDVVRVGPLTLTAHATPGHTPGGTSWTWTSCEGARCLHIAYVDSLNAISARGFRFGDTFAHRGLLDRFAASFATVAALPCDILVTPHPDVSRLWQRVARRDAGDADALIDASACRNLAQSSREQLDARLDAERAGRVR